MPRNMSGRDVVFVGPGGTGLRSTLRDNCVV